VGKFSKGLDRDNPGKGFSVWRLTPTKSRAACESGRAQGGGNGWELCRAFGSPGRTDGSRWQAWLGARLPPVWSTCSSRSLWSVLIRSSVASFVLQSERDQSACEAPEEKCVALEAPRPEEAVAQEPEEGSLEELAAPQKE